MSANDRKIAEKGTPTVSSEKTIENKAADRLYTKEKEMKQIKKREQTRRVEKEPEKVASLKCYR